MAKQLFKERDAALPLAKLSRLFQIIAALKAGRWTIRQLVERFDSSKSSMYRYLELLEDAGFYIDKDFHDRYFIVTTDDDPMQAQFSMEEMAMMRTLIQADANHPLKSSLLKKLSLNSEIDGMPRLFMKAHLGNLVEQITHAMRCRHRVVLKNYHSANSQAMRDRLVECIHFGDNYGTIIALDCDDLVCKQFKLDRIGEVIETHKPFEHEALHEQKTSDIFGIAGNTTYYVTLRLSVRASLLLREEFPASIPYLTPIDNGYEFTGPVANFNGVGRFVLGLPDEVEVAGPEEFKAYVNEKISRPYFHT